MIDYIMMLFMDLGQCFVDGCKMTIACYITHIWSKGVMHIDQISRERCGNILDTAYDHSHCDSNCRLMIT
jgi:hypothetical protein